MSKYKPLPGAMSIVGKDNNKRKVILPTNPENIISDLIVKTKRKKTSKIRKFFNAIKIKVTRVKINPLETKAKYQKLKKRDYDYTCSVYMEAISKRILAAQEAWKKNKRAEKGFNF